VTSGGTSAHLSLETVRGTAAVSWRSTADGRFTLDVTVPVRATAEMREPASAAAAVTESGLYQFATN
jgi:hypothetical protein